MLSCCGSATMILTEASQGVRRSLYCSLGKHERLAPVYCVLPLTGAAVLCHIAVVVGLAFIGHFAYRAGSRALGGVVWDADDQRALLRANLKLWRTATNGVLLSAATIFLLVGPACAGLARTAFIFLASGFFTLYATMLFFDDDADQASLPPRFLRFLGVYTLIGITFTTYSWGFLEGVGLDNSLRGGLNTSNLSGHLWLGVNTSDGVRRMKASTACTTAGQALLSPARCTVPLDFASGVSLWWVASPLFASLLVSQGKLRRLLQHWRRRVDVVILLGIFMLTMMLRDRCNLSSPVAFGFAEMSAYAVLVLLAMRRMHPAACDAWRGPLCHLVTYSSPDANTAVHEGDDIRDELQCAICLSELQGQAICKAPCGHDFHLECLEEWVTLARGPAAGCPLCRESLQMPQTVFC